MMVPIHYRFFKKQSLRNKVFEILFFKSVADTLQTLCLCFEHTRVRNIIFQTGADRLPTLCFANACFRNIVFQTVNTLQTHCFANKVIVFETPRFKRIMFQKLGFSNL